MKNATAKEGDNLGEHDHAMIFVWIGLCSVLAMIWMLNVLRQKHIRKRWRLFPVHTLTYYELIISSQKINNKYPTSQQLYAARLLRDGKCV